MADKNKSLEDRVKSVTKQIALSCNKSGRNPEDVTLIAVSKTKPVPLLQEAYYAGCRHFGENKVQELMDKHDQLPEDVQWHMIGHLQRNKVKYIVDKVALIHSVDSLRLAEEISKEAGKIGRTIPILIEVNIAGEPTKYGASFDEVPELVKSISVLSHIRIDGLMAVAPFVEKQEENRKYFAKLRQLYVDIKRKNIDNVNMIVLSMGMTGDFEIAVEEGATCVRVGTGIFGDRHYDS